MGFLIVWGYDEKGLLRVGTGKKALAGDQVLTAVRIVDMARDFGGQGSGRNDCHDSRVW